MLALYGDFALFQNQTLRTDSTPELVVPRGCGSPVGEPALTSAPSVRNERCVSLAFVAAFLDVDDDTNNFAVIEINNVVRFENFLHFRCVDSEIIRVRRLVVLSGNKINDRSSSDFHLVISIHYFRDSNFSSS